MLNPVLRRELKTSMRSWKNFLAIMFYLIVMLGVMIIFWFSNNYNYSSIGITLSDTVYFYVGMASVQLAFILFISPAITASSISGERERQTLDLMLLTKMKPISIVTGKLMASLSIIILMIVTSMPIFALVMNYGGVSLLQIVEVSLLFILIACSMGSAGIFFSSLFKKTAVATVITYIFIMFICGVNFIVGILYLELGYTQVNGVYRELNPFIIILCFGTNPIVGFADLLDKQMGWEIIYSLSYVLGRSQNANISWIRDWIGVISIGFNFVISAVFLALSAYNIKPVKKKLIVRKREKKD